MVAIMYGADDRMFAPAPVGVQTAAYSAVANSFVPCNTTSAGFTVTLPAAPVDRAVVAVKLVAGTNTLTIAAAGTDVFDVAGGSTSISWSTLDQGVFLQYSLAAGIWYQVANYSAGGGGSGVTSFNSRTGAVVPASGDYSFSLISGTIASGQVPTLNQNTTGSAASFTGALAGDVTGTQGATTVGKIQGVAITSAEATLVSDLNNATSRSATATLLPGEETIFTGSTASQTLTLPASPPSSSLNTITNTASVTVTLAPGAGATISNFGTAGNITLPVGYSFSLIYIGTTWYVQQAGPSDFATSSALSLTNGGTGATTRQAAINALTGTQTSGDYLRSNGTNASLSALAAADLTGTVTVAHGGTGFTQAPVVSTGATTVTGVTVATALASGQTLAASTLAAGQVYHFIAWGTMTTTVDTQTFTFNLDWGGVSGTSLLTWGASNPNGSATVSGVSWSTEFTITMNTATSMSVMGWLGMDFYFSSLQQQVTTVANTSSEQFVLGVTPSASAASITCNGFVSERKW